MLEIVKLALRYNSNYFDTELQAYINACKNDLILGGFDESKYIDTDDSLKSTVIAYCKWQTNFQGQGDRWGRIYTSMKMSLVLNNKY